MTVVEYDPYWPRDFARIKETLDTAGLPVFAVEHVGSTSIPGMCAKPIVDIDVVIRDYDVFADTKAGLETLGYRHNGDQDVPAREVFKRSNGTHPVLDRVSHHLYVCPAGSPELRRHILFRDYLRTHPEAIAEYCAIKKAIIERVGPDDRAAYVRVKETEFTWFFKGIVEAESRLRGETLETPGLYPFTQPGNSFNPALGA